MPLFEEKNLNYRKFCTAKSCMYFLLSVKLISIFWNGGNNIKNMS
jgi:hypothetical protein